MQDAETGQRTEGGRYEIRRQRREAAAGQSDARAWLSALKAVRVADRGREGGLRQW